MSKHIKDQIGSDQIGSPTKSLRSSYEVSEDVIVGKLVTSLEAKTGCQLPTKSQVLSHFLYLNSQEMRNSSKDLVSKVVIEKVEVIWSLSGIPFSHYKTGRSKLYLQKLYQKYDSIKKNVNRPIFKDQKNIFCRDLAQLFDIGLSNAAELIRSDRLRSKTAIEADLKFYEDQKGPRIMAIGTEDRKYTEKVANRQNVRIANSKSYVKEKAICDQQFKTVGEQSAVARSRSDSDIHAFEKKTISPSTQMKTLVLDKSPLSSPRILATADRIGLSTRERTMFMAAVIKDGGGKLDDYTISQASTLRVSKAGRSQMASEIQSNFKVPKFISVHWDGKILLNKEGTKDNRVAVVITGHPNIQEGKILGISTVQEGTGYCEAHEIFAKLKKWDCLSNVLALVFDTTSSNSGKWKGACVILEQLLRRKILMLACRHHILELILSGVYKHIFGATKSPTNEDFKAFCMKWSSLNAQEKLKTLNLNSREMKGQAENVIEFLTKLLSSSNSFPRDDYKEVAELSLVLLGVKPPQQFKMRKPGAMHHARWMSAILYSAKMYLLSEQLCYGKEYVEKLELFLQFATIVYVPAWFTAPICVDSVYNDLRFWKALKCYPEKRIGEISLTILERHFWYLTEEISVFALFSSKITLEEKKKMAKQLLKYPRKVDYESGVPTYPVITVNTRPNTLIGQKSWTVFNLLGHNADWLKQSPAEWAKDEEFNEANTILRNLKVVNDPAERAIKMITEYASSITHNEEEKQYLLQIVENHRNLIPVVKKSVLENI